MFKTVLRPNTSYQFRYRERKKPIRNNCGTKLQQMFNYPCYLPTLQQTGGAVDVVYMHRFRTGFEFPCVVPSVLTLSGPATPLQPSCKGCLVAQSVSVQFVFVYSNMLHKEMWIMLVRIGERWCAPTSLLQLGRYPLISYLQKGLHFTNFSYL